MNNTIILQLDRSTGSYKPLFTDYRHNKATGKVEPVLPSFLKASHI